MFPGPDIVIKCPNCRSFYKLCSLTSGNTFGATLWSDGYLDAPMLPRQPAITRCHKCSGFFWIRDAKKVGEIDHSLCSQEYEFLPRRLRFLHRAPAIRELAESEYYEAIEAGLGSTAEKETRIRTLAWWRANDADRIDEKESREPEQPNPQKTANLSRLFDVLDGNSADVQLMKAEVARQLGRFDDAITLLSAIHDSKLEWFKVQIIAFCESKMNKVRVFR